MKFLNFLETLMFGLLAIISTAAISLTVSAMVRDCQRVEKPPMVIEIVKKGTPVVDKVKVEKVWREEDYLVVPGM